MTGHCSRQGWQGYCSQNVLRTHVHQIIPFFLPTMSKDEVTTDDVDETYFCHHYYERDIPAAVQVIRDKFPNRDPMVCYLCNAIVAMHIRFGHKCEVGRTIMCDIIFSCPTCGSGMAYFV